MAFFRTHVISPPPAAWDFEQLLVNGDEYFGSLEQGIRGAKQSIDLETYIFDNDPLGERLTQGLIEAHKRGVAVRVVVDGVGAQGWVYHLGRPLCAAGVPAWVYHQLPWERFLSQACGWDARGAWGQLFARINNRDHRKVCIVDGAQAWIGSLNVSANHMQSLRGENAWRDTGITVRGEDVKYLRAAFNRIWPARDVKSRAARREARLALKASAGSSVRLNATRRLRRINYKQLLARIADAKVRLWITTAYFVPSGSFLAALTAAANRCVDVRLITSSKSDVFFMPWVAAAYQYGLMRAGIQLYDYLPSILHAKTMIIDDLAMIGSSNLNQRSLIHDLEADIFTSNVQTVSRLTEQYLLDVERSRGLTLHDFRAAPFWQRWLGYATLSFKHWL